MQTQTYRRGAVGSKKSRGAASSLLVLLLMGLSFVMVACGGDAHIQQQATQNKAQLDQLLQHAQAIGIPSSSLRSIFTQEKQLSSTSAPFNLFNDQPLNTYNQNLATHYTQLTVQTQDIVTTYTNQAQLLAQHDLQNFQSSLTQARMLGLPIQSFSQQFSQEQALLSAAKYPKDYALVSSRSKAAQQTLTVLQDVAHQLHTFQQTIAQMQQAHLDVTAMQTQYQDDQQALTTIKTMTEAQNFNALLDSQYQQSVVNSTLAIPYVTSAKYNEFALQIKQLKTYGGDTTAYQKRLAADQTVMNNIKSLQDYQGFVQQINTDLASMHDDLVQSEAVYLVKQFHQEVNAWGNAHLYHDKFDGKNYPLDAGYMDAGIGSDVDRDLSWSYTPDDFQAMVVEAQNAIFNLHLLEADYSDTTPYNQVHATDMQMIAHYKLQKGQLLMVSLSQQAMRVYQDGQLVKSFLVTTGRTELPSVPGVWSVLDRKSPTTFKSVEPKGSPYWYPDTPIHYAILYHWGGYFVHDSWWRVDYGPGTQFPHVDSGGDQSFAGSGSHGCVNMQEEQAAWVYSHTDLNTQIVIY